MSKFNVGDRVSLVDEKYERTILSERGYSTIGWICKVIEGKKQDTFDVKFPQLDPKNDIANHVVCSINANDLILAEEDSK